MSRTSAGRERPLRGNADRESSRPPDPSPQEIISTHARTSFSFAARFLPAPQRADAIDLYAFFRTLDDLVDESPRSAGMSAIAGELDGWQAWLHGARRDDGPREPLGANLARIIDRYGIPIEVFLQMIDGLRADMEAREIENDAALQTYCYQVASTVGFAMAHVLGTTSPHALAAAEKLGAAMQLTNILRDVGEDLDSGRIYLPTSLLTQHDLCRADLIAMHQNRVGPDERYRAMLCGQVHRAHRLYEHAMPGIWLLPGGCRLPILVAARLYRRLLTIIERNDYDTLHQRAATTRIDKTQEALISWALVTRQRVDRRPFTEPALSTPEASVLEVQSD